MINKFSISFLLLLLLLPISPQAQHHIPAERLPREMLDVLPPSARVMGSPGEMRISDRSCRSLPASQVRQRIVDIASQEWTWFGASVLDMTRQEELDANAGRSRRWWRTNWMSEEEARRVSDDIAGYWAAAPDSSWLLERQNQRWREQGITARWRDFWSAAFISWVMCESGLGEYDKFQRAIAHHSYIDQAIRARDGLEPQAAYIAYDIGEAEILPGDMLCRGSRPEYRNLEQRRGQMGEGARTHCDVVVELDAENKQIKVIGGNVRGAVRMKLLPAIPSPDSYLQPAAYGERSIFAHLKLSTGNKDFAIKNIKPVSSKSG